MRKSKQRTVVTILTMSLIAVMLIALYYYLTKQTKPVEKLSEAEVLLSKDLKLYYPATPKEVVKLYSSILQTLYTDLEDDETKALALKIRELYDKELLEKNPEEDYLTNIYSEIIEWKKAKRTITDFSFVHEEDYVTDNIDGIEYTTVHVIYTFEEKTKHLEEWRFLLRRDDENHWKILGWNYLPGEE
ncbi:MAG: hypothetical protein E7255_12495 [Lachnospiraceae bacterium]|nr:hypothetical protein [Lachnospiraceae bacterium]